MDHRSNCIYHSIKNAELRYGIKLTKYDILAMSKIIRNGKSTVIHNSDNKTRSKTFHEVLYNGTLFKVIYSKSVKVLVTILPNTTNGGNNDFTRSVQS